MSVFVKTSIKTRNVKHARTYTKDATSVIKRVNVFSVKLDGIKKMMDVSVNSLRQCTKSLIFNAQHATRSVSNVENVAKQSQSASNVTPI